MEIKSYYKEKNKLDKINSLNAEAAAFNEANKGKKDAAGNDIEYDEELFHNGINILDFESLNFSAAIDMGGNPIWFADRSQFNNDKIIFHTIDTKTGTGNLIISSAGGTIDINDNVDISGNLVCGGTGTFTGDLIAFSSLPL